MTRLLLGALAATALYIAFAIASGVATDRRRRRSGIPTVADFRRMGPEATAEWHRQSGIAAQIALDPEWAEIEEAQRG